MQFYIVLLLALVSTISANSLPADSKAPNNFFSVHWSNAKHRVNNMFSFHWSDVKHWMAKSIWDRFQGNMTWNTPFYHGKMLATLGKSKEGFYERAGYKQMIFNDDRGKLDGEVDEKMVLRLMGNDKLKSNVTGRLRWTKDSAKVTVDLVKPLLGKNTTITVNGAGNFDLKKNKEVLIEKLNGAFILRKRTKANENKV